MSTAVSLFVGAGHARDNACSRAWPAPTKPGDQRDGLNNRGLSTILPRSVRTNVAEGIQTCCKR